VEQGARETEWASMFFPVSEWFPAFVLTVVVELPIVLLVLRRPGVSRLRLAVLVVFANLATHPAVWFVFTQLYLVGTVEYVVVAESWAVGAEALFYAVALPAITPRQAIVAAVAANVGSFLVGRLLNQALYASIG
jgi:hypothetical protein